MKSISNLFGEEVHQVKKITQGEDDSINFFFFLIDSSVSGDRLVGRFALCFPQSLANKQINHKLSV